MTMYYNRDIKQIIADALKEMPVVAITGLRQTGKSTFLQSENIFEGRRYLSLDDFALLEAAKENPDAFVDSKEPLTIDEVQKCPELLTAIKRKVDKNQIPGHFLLSGSANFLVLKGITESLAGRAVYFTMHPFSRRELSKTVRSTPFLHKFFDSLLLPKNHKPVSIKNEEILKGGMPQVCLENIKNQNLWFKGYEQTYFERDIRNLSQIDNMIPFRNLLHLSALRTAQILSTSNLARDAKLNYATASRYLSLFEATFVIYRLNPYLRNKAARLIKSPKMYFSDSGIACFLADIENLNLEMLKGSFWETYIAQNLLSIIDSTWPQARLYYWNIQGRYEVDFVIESNRKCIAVETKTSNRWEPKDLTGLKTFVSTTPDCIAGILAYNGTEPVKLDERIWAIPLDLVLS